MPIQVNQLKANMRTTFVTYFDEDPIKVKYRPSELTPEVEEQIVEAFQDGDNGVTVGLLSRMVVEWDVMNGEEQFPLEPDALRTLPSPFLNAVLGAIREDMAPKPKKARSSFGR